MPVITDAGTVREILDHIGESTQPPRIAPARGAPLWEATRASEQAGNDPQWYMSAQPVPEFEFDQRIAWRGAFFAYSGVGLCAGFSVYRFLALTRQFLPWEWARCRICHGSDDRNQIFDGMWGEMHDLHAQPTRG